MALSRRAFIGMGGAAAGGAATGTLAWLLGDGTGSELTVEGPAPAPSPDPGPTPGPAVAPDGDRVLVVVQLGGGNDGLNTLVPADGRYRDLRPTLALPEADLLPLTGATGFGLAPALAPLLPLWREGRLAAVNGMGMVGQSRSHFVALDSWWRGSPDPTLRGGWLGRWLDATIEGEPDPLRAIALGSGAPALAAERSPSTVVQSPELFSLRVAPGIDDRAQAAAFAALAEPLSSDPLLAAVQESIPATISAVDLLDQALGEADAATDQVAGRASVSALLTAAAEIVGMGVGTRIIHVGVGGFDTHSEQLRSHPDLLADVATGVAQFFAAAEAQGNADRVLLVTTSEFGRRVRENGSAGTDHGTAGLQVLCGAGVAGGRVIGDVDLVNLDDGDVPVDVDTRSVYAAALDWLGGPTDEILGGTYDRLGLLTA